MDGEKAFVEVHVMKLHCHPLMRSTVIALLVLLLGSFSMAAKQADTAQKKFQAALALMERAEAAHRRGALVDAKDLFVQAGGAFAKLADEYPEWETGVTGFRLKYCTSLAEEVTQEQKKRGDGEPMLRVPPLVVAEAEASVERDAALKRCDLLAARAAAHLARGALKDARALLLESIRIDSDHLSTRHLTAALYCAEGGFEQALEVARSLLEDNRKDAAAHVALGAAHFGLNQTKEAAKEMANALKVNPKLSEAHFNLAHILLRESPPNVQRARVHYARALELGAERDKRLDDRLGVKRDVLPTDKRSGGE